MCKLPVMANTDYDFVCLPTSQPHVNLISGSFISWPAHWWRRKCQYVAFMSLALSAPQWSAHYNCGIKVYLFFCHLSFYWFWGLTFFCIFLRCCFSWHWPYQYSSHHRGAPSHRSYAGANVGEVVLNYTLLQADLKTFFCRFISADPGALSTGSNRNYLGKINSSV